MRQDEALPLPPAPNPGDRGCCAGTGCPGEGAAACTGLALGGRGGHGGDRGDRVTRWDEWGGTRRHYLEARSPSRLVWVK